MFSFLIFWFIGVGFTACVQHYIQGKTWGELSRIELMIGWPIILYRYFRP